MEQSDLRPRVTTMLEHTAITSVDGTGGYLIPGNRDERDPLIARLIYLLKQTKCSII